MSEGKKAMILIILFLVVMGGFYLYKMNDYKKDIEQVEEDIKKEQEYLTLIENQLKTLAKPPEEEINLFYRQFPDSKGIPQLFQFFHEVSEKNGIKIVSLNIDESSETDDQNDDQNKDQEDQKKSDASSNSSNSKDEADKIYRTLTFQMQIEGYDYEKIRSFIQNIYETNRLINFKELKVSAEKEGSSTDLTFETYYIPDMHGHIKELEPIPAYPPSDNIIPIRIDFAE